MFLQLAQHTRLPQRGRLVGSTTPWHMPARDHAPQQTTSLFDDLVGAGEQHRRHVDADCLCGLQVDDEFEFFAQRADRLALLNPVMFPPGCARLATSLLPTGSGTATKTMGIAVVARWAARAAIRLIATRTLTFSAARSAATLTKRSDKARQKSRGHKSNALTRFGCRTGNYPSNVNPIRKVTW
jgi:hypothetical protein